MSVYAYILFTRLSKRRAEEEEDMDGEKKGRKGGEGVEEKMGKGEGTRKKI